MNVVAIPKVGMSLSAWFDSMFSEYDDKLGLYPFKVNALVIKDDSPRGKFFEPLLEMGVSLIEPILKHTPLLRVRGRNDSLFFTFPERWMSPLEQREFMHLLATHPDAKNITLVRMFTQSPIIISDLDSTSGMVLIMGGIL